MSAVLSRPSVYNTITNHIIAAIEEGAGDCMMPWHAGTVPVVMPQNACTDMRYRGINIVSLWASAAVRRYPSGYWASYEQWRKLGAQVRKGECGTPIIFYKRLDQGEEEPASDETDVPKVALKHSHVFNFAQVDGWELPEIARRVSLVDTSAEIEAFIAATGANVRHGGLSAFYERVEDYIAMPPRELFTGTATSSPTEAYYAVLLHELTHWTGAPHRLDRAKGKHFGDPKYAFEELVAELGAAFLCSALRLVNLPRPDHAAYLGHWLDILKKDNRAIFAAAGLAQQAVEYLRGAAGGSYP